jgi:GABA permease
MCRSGVLVDTGPEHATTPGRFSRTTFNREDLPVSDTKQANRSARVRTVDRGPAWRVLIVANQTATSPALISDLQIRAQRGPVDLHLVVPALNSHLRHWLSDTDDAVSAAGRRADHAATVLKSHGLPITVEVGDSVPLLAIGDALAQFDADEILISTLPPNRSHWLEHNLVELARDRFDVPVSHVVAGEEVVRAA